MALQRIPNGDHVVEFGTQNRVSLELFLKQSALRVGEFAVQKGGQLLGGLGFSQSASSLLILRHKILASSARARCRRLLTVPRGSERISLISS